VAALTLIDLFEQMATAGAADLHLCAGSPPVLRVRGELEQTLRARLGDDYAASRDEATVALT
jgi:Tfp pilus assembly pilus retraction ATPase PilT